MHFPSIYCLPFSFLLFLSTPLCEKLNWYSLCLNLCSEHSSTHEIGWCCYANTSQVENVCLLLMGGDFSKLTCYFSYLGALSSTASSAISVHFFSFNVELLDLGLSNSPLSVGLAAFLSPRHQRKI